MSFTVINRFAMAHLHSHLAVVYHHELPTPGDVAPPAQPPNSTVRGGASLEAIEQDHVPGVLTTCLRSPPGLWGSWPWTESPTVATSAPLGFAYGSRARDRQRPV